MASAKLFLCIAKFVTYIIAMAILTSIVKVSFANANDNTWKEITINEGSLIGNCIWMKLGM